ncbi:MAG: 5'/3'-nucleotidase SurE [SAR86 cluster bacterium]|uniref:5'-nucleotidase SurE n=1 Tax=SAR86 cluster bacterium TaxID=2030880 RepID=A0A2A4MT88_9GAMM|nr:MAG: 5'/3'-nucleotidase SurE [SAR86 cluster bacterium]
MLSFYSRVRATFKSLLIIATVALASVANAQNYRILISNDDGIESPLLAVLKQEIASLDNVEVVLVAPHINQSGSSHSSSGGEMDIERVFRDGEFFGYAVYGKPADAVRFGIVHLGAQQPFDLVISGINRGANVGMVSHLSGTVGAAMEGIYHGIPAIAVSQDTSGVDTLKSAKFVSQLVQRYQREGAPQGIVISINIPSGEIKGVQVRPMIDSYLQTDGYTLNRESGNTATYERQRIVVESSHIAGDTFAYQQGYIAITPLKFDWTDHAFIQEVQSWDLQLQP